jgi:hypothetical protein
MITWAKLSGGVCREAIQVDTLGCPIRQESFDDMAAMNRGAIPDDDQAASHLAQQVGEERDHIHRVDGVVLAVEIELTLRRDGTDRREMVTGIPFPQNRGLAHRRIRADDTGQRIESGLVYEEDRLVLGFRPLLRVSQVSSRQWVMAASSRWRARRAGFCGLQRIVRHKRPT